MIAHDVTTTTMRYSLALIEESSINNRQVCKGSSSYI